MLTSSQIVQFKNFGYVVVPEFADLDYCETAVALARSELKKQVMPIQGRPIRVQRKVVIPHGACWGQHNAVRNWWIGQPANP
jgi:hypothetical protein